MVVLELHQAQNRAPQVRPVHCSLVQQHRSIVRVMYLAVGQRRPTQPVVQHLSLCLRQQLFMLCGPHVAMEHSRGAAAPRPARLVLRVPVCPVDTIMYLAQRGHHTAVVKQPRPIAVSAVTVMVVN